MRIGFAGLGKMGRAMAARLHEADADVRVWNRDPAKAEATGLKTAETPQKLAEQVDTVITMLSDDHAVMQVYRGAAGLTQIASGKLFIEMSTVRPQTHERLAADIEQAGGSFVECPVGGTVGPARAGKLLGLAGGDPAAVTQARPVLDMLCRRVLYVGPVGAAATLKLAINLPLLVFWQAFGEANALIRHLKLDPEFVVDLFADSSGGANVLKLRAEAIAGALAGRSPGPATFDVHSICKDLGLMLAEADARGIALPVSERTLLAFREAVGAGLGAEDSVTLPAFWAAKADAVTHEESDEEAEVG